MKTLWQRLVEWWHGGTTCQISGHTLPKPYESYFDADGKCNTWILPTCPRCGKRINA